MVLHDIQKRYPFLFLHISLCLSYKITNHLLNALELKYAPFYHCRKWSPILFVVKNRYSILIETTNKSVKSVLRHRILIYFIENFFQCGISSYNQIKSKYTPELTGHAHMVHIVHIVNQIRFKMVYTSK